jgi:arsenite-transporting ATPase
MRTILFTGKGGVGKTTVAAATAMQCAQQGARVAVISTDPAHSLADSFDVPLDHEMTEVAPGCSAMQLDATTRMESSWGEIQSYLREVFDWAGLDEIEAEELAVIPGMDEIFALTDIVSVERSGDFDVLIVDCAPTAETIRLLSLPDVLSWYMDKAFPLGRRLTKSLGPVVARVASIPVAGDEVFGAADRLYNQLSQVRDLLRDRSRSTVRLVVNPEKMVVAEARRTYTYLSLFGYSVDAVVVNRLLPDHVSDPFFESWKASHAEHLQVIEEGFASVPILKAYLADAEIVGAERLSEFGAGLYSQLDAGSVLADVEPMRISRNEDGFVLSVDLPFASKSSLHVGRGDEELFIRVGPYRRSVLLPDSLRRREVAGASLRDGVLNVRFL